MSCQTHELPREDRLEAEVEIIENDSLNNKSNDKNQEEVSAEYLHEKKRKRSARKKDYDMEEERLRRWNESVQQIGLLTLSTNHAPRAYLHFTLDLNY